MANAVISPKFTIEDIHKIREENYEKTKNMTMAEKIAYYNGLGKEAAKEIEKRKSDLLRQQGSVMNGLRDIQESAANLIVSSL